MKTFILLLMICLSATFAFSQTITSTELGGNWSEWTTWIGGVVPDSGNNVIINGPVRLLNYNNVCNDLMVNAGKDLWSGTGWFGNLTVLGNILNNGIIKGAMEISLGGNIESYGQWIEGETGIPKIRFVGSDQFISHAPGNGFHSSFKCADSTVNIYFNSDIHLWNESSDLGSAEIFTQGYTFKVDDGALYDARIVSNDTLDFNMTWTGFVEISGDYILKGTITAFNTNILRGTATNLGTLQSIPGPYLLTIDGNINNYGTVTTTVHISGNIDNHGSWTSYETKFTGSNEKIISQSPGAVFEGYFIVIDPDAVITLASDVSLNVTEFTLNNATLNCGPYNLTANTVFTSGTILSYGDITEHGYYQYITFEGSMGLHGESSIRECIVNGDIINYDTISPPYPIPGNYLTVNGLFENRGLVTTVPINLYGDLANHGEINTSIINVQGDSSQTITFSEPINEPVYFHAMITGISYQWMKNGVDIPDAAQSDLYFNTLQLNDHGIYQCRVDTVGASPVYSREITVNLITDVDDEFSEIPSSFILYQNYPNPFNPSTKIKFTIPSNVKREISNVSLKVYDVLGNEVVTLIDGYKPAGEYEVEFNTVRTGLRPVLTSGVYFYQLKAGDFTKTKKMILLR